MSRLSPNTVVLVKKTAPAFRARSADIARLTYERLRADHRASAVFDTGLFLNPGRSRWFADLMVMAIENIDDPDALARAATRMGERHLAEGISSAHYLYLFQAWPDTVRDVLGLGATASVVEAWDETFWYLASLLLAKADEIQRMRDWPQAA